MHPVIFVVVTVGIVGGCVYADCQEGDEGNQCSNSTCPLGYWRCTNGQCVTLYTRCDNGTTGAEPCNDGSDEVGCENFTCPAPRVATEIGSCIQQQAGDENLCYSSDGTAEYSPSKPRPECLFTCADGQLIGYADRCNGFVDCNDATDEESCSSNICPENHFQCFDGQCLHSYRKRCDDIKHTCLDCLDGSDEDHCLLSVCPPNFYRCRTGQCMEHDVCDAINDAYRCDPRTDPTDHCRSNVINNLCPQGYFRCTDGRCLHHISRCNNVTDCQGGEDEDNCGHPECRDDQIDCGDGSCVPRVLACDGFNHCSSGIDESACSYNGSVLCPDGFSCPNTSLCLARDALCDGYRNCQWGEDERDCFTECPKGCTCFRGSIDCKFTMKDYGNVHQSNDTWPFQIYKSNTMPLHIVFELLLQLCALRYVPIGTFAYVPYLQYCDLSHNRIETLSPGDFSGLYRLSSLNLSHNIISTIDDFTFKGLRLAYLDISKNWVQVFSEDIFGGMAIDGILYTENNTLLCQYRPQHLPEENCHPSPYFRCVSTGELINSTARCDGYMNCTDESDEEYCHLVVCSPEHWKCDDGPCIPIASRCDNGTSGLPSCRDGSDERNCQRCAALMEECNANGTGSYCRQSSSENSCQLDDTDFTTIYPKCTNGSKQRASCECGNEVFSCSYSQQCVGLGDRCNGVRDCLDGSDEESCETNECPTYMFRCSSGQCLPWYKNRCDYIKHTDLDCLDGTDEDRCPLVECPEGYYRCKTGQCMEFDLCDTERRNVYQCDPRTDPTDHCGSNRCPEGYFRCTDGRCLHHISRCNNVTDCQGGEDEDNCGHPECRDDQIDCGDGSCVPRVLACDGYKDCKSGIDEDWCIYNAWDCPDNSCSKNGMCIPKSAICDGTSQCPDSEDERFCAAQCPSRCECVKGQIDCDGNTISKSDSNESNTFIWPFEGIEPIGKSELLTLSNTYSLSSENCRLTSIPTALFLYVPFLQVLNVRYNKITKVSAGDFHGLYRLSVLDLSFNLIETIENYAFRGLRVSNLNLDGNIIKNFDLDVFTGMTIDGELRSISYSFCCIRPDHLPAENCYPKQDLFSSCDDLMKDETFRLLLWIIGLLALLGNLVSLLLRCMDHKQSMKISHEIFITHLCFADVLMGIYLIMIAAVDESFRGKYVTNDIRWRTSPWCNLAGMFSMVSCETSVLFISLITIDRFILVKYPFGNFRFGRRAASLISTFVWMITLVLATFPLLIPSYFKGDFYSKSAVCIAQPLTLDSLAGWEYSVTVYLGLNFVLFLLIGVGQFMIYYEIVSTRRKVRRLGAGHNDEIKIARKLMAVAVTDFLCWIPIGCLCIMALAGIPISSEVYTWVVIFVLPINSALNPFLYTIMNKLC